MTDKELLSKLQTLKEIKPRKDWVSLSKMNILGSQYGVAKVAPKSVAKGRFASTFERSNIFKYNNKLAYSLAAFVFIFAGLVGVLKYGFPENLNTNVKSSQQSVASLTAENELKSKVEDLKVKSQTLAALTQETSQPQAVASALKEVQDATKNVTQTLQQDPQLAKTIALDINNNKSILDVIGGSSGTDLSATSDGLDKAVDDPLMASIEQEKLTPEQQTEFNNIKTLYGNGQYDIVLRDLLLMNAGGSNANADVNNSPTVNSK